MLSAVAGLVVKTELGPQDDAIMANKGVVLVLLIGIPEPKPVIILVVTVIGWQFDRSCFFLWRFVLL